ncbi:hypothetical protein ABTE32_21875, partial [Acinetobacter baumannii]
LRLASREASALAVAVLGNATFLGMTQQRPPARLSSRHNCAAVLFAKIEDGQKGLIAAHHQIRVLRLEQLATTALDMDLALRPIDP